LEEEPVIDDSDLVEGEGEFVEGEEDFEGEDEEIEEVEESEIAEEEQQVQIEEEQQQVPAEEQGGEEQPEQPLEEVEQDPEQETPAPEEQPEGEDEFVEPDSVGRRLQEVEERSVTLHHADVENGEKTTLKIMDATYTVDAAAIMYQFPQQQGEDFIIKARATRGDENETILNLQIIDTLTEDVYELADLDGTAVVEFTMRPESYLSGQTVCQGELPSGQWSSKVCLTALDISQFKVECTCSLTAGVTQISFKNDLTLARGAAAKFPET
jgi:hypothetical protein